MARLFPRIDVSEIQNPGERKVAEALVRQLSSQVEVFHSFNWLRTGAGPLVEGECDFVVLDPANGLLFVEVKGGALEYRAEDESWVRTLASGAREVMKKDPFDQVRDSMHEIVNRVQRQLPGRPRTLPFTHGYAVAFPDCRFTGSLPASMVPDLVLDALKCREMAPSLQRVFDRFRRAAHPELSAHQVEAIQEALHPRFALIPVVWRRVEDQEERLRRLTAEQQKILEFLGGRKLAAIRGVAGSGKTILALAKAQETARRGLRTLFLCYNRPLMEWLVQASPESFGDTLTINTYHGLVEELCRKAGIDQWQRSNFKDPAFWASEAPELLMQACDRLPVADKFDAVIVDEGQDFRDLWWTSLDAVFRNPQAKACYYVFFDPNQNLFVEAPAVPPELGEHYELSVNCRNTVRIATHCAALVGKEGRTRESAPIGDEPELIQAHSVSEAFDLAGKRVREWCMPNAGGLKRSQVAVLAPGNSEREWPTDFQTVPLTRDFEAWRQDKGVLMASWARFKGLEADAIVVVEPPADAEHERVNRYVAHSRAKHFLTIVRVGA